MELALPFSLQEPELWEARDHAAAITAMAELLKTRKKQEVFFFPTSWRYFLW